MPVFPLIAPQQLKYAKIKRVTPATIRRIGNDFKESSKIKQNYISIIEYLFIKITKNFAIIYSNVN